MKIQIGDKEWELTEEQFAIFAEILSELGFYSTGVRFGNSEFTESITMVGNNKAWPAPIDNSPIPDVELSLDKILDGYPTIYELIQTRHSPT